MLAPINGMYGIKDAEGNVNVYNDGGLYVAIDVAMFILMIGGFLGITMKTGAIQAGIALLVRRLGGHERWMIPILMTVFAIGGTTFGMAEESLAFYVLIITVMIAAGYDALTGALVILLGCGIGVLGSRSARLATADARAGEVDLELSKSLSDVEDVDLAEAAFELARSDMILQVAQASGSRLLQTSLLEFLG